ncbi:glycoside hydrolase family 5 protein [Methylobacterium sp. Leaf112]|uniref:glycoside hydrolase family 5 protein n=1 Tax=Methylobacterium sp. Leaf112 TaxID=1736258 RepID=UPI000A5D18B7|nr:cellulase family glycosylhydrolase [Methylobacterium sp. Leaf112]
MTGRVPPTRRGVIAAGLAAGGLAGHPMPAALGREPVRARPVSPGPAAPRETPSAKPVVLRRGINLWPWFSLTREYPAPRTDYAWPAFDPDRPVPTRADLAGLAHAGFDFVRLPIDPGPFLFFTGRTRAVLFGMLDAAVAMALAEGLTVVLNLHANAATHHYTPEALYGGPDAPLLDAYRDLVAELARALARHPQGRVALEPVNEPPQACGAEAWGRIQAGLLGAARAAAPALTLVATGACGSLVDGLTALDPAALTAFRPLLYTFHFYEPYLFSHQGAPWMDEPVYRALNAVPWPASAGRLDATLAAVRRRMAGDAALPAARKATAYAETELKLAEYFAARPDRGFLDRGLAPVRAWALRHGIPTGEILLGEFGALRSDHRYVASGAADRARYVGDVRRSAEAAGFPWAFWNLFDGMGLVQGETRSLDPALLGALGLPAPPAGAPSGASPSGTSPSGTSSP